jgi:hypothetical protein
VRRTNSNAIHVEVRDVVWLAMIIATVVPNGHEWVGGDTADNVDRVLLL